MQILAAAIVGLVFGTGLTLSSMVNPAVVLGFLDVLGAWNPALLLVMIGALAVASLGYRLVLGRKPLLAPAQNLPTARSIDAPLMAGAVLFGIGWGLAGICPGPAVTLLGIAPGSAVLFLAAMLAGMLLAALYQRARAARRPASNAADG